MLSCPTLLLIRYIGFSRQEYWNGLPSPSPGDLPDPGIEPMSPALACGFFTTEPPEKHQLVQFSCQSCVTLCDPVHYITPGLSVHHQLLELAQTHVHQVGHAIQPSIFSHPLLRLPSIFPSIRVFSNESALRIKWPKYVEFQLQHQSFQ